MPQVTVRATDASGTIQPLADTWVSVIRSGTSNNNSASSAKTNAQGVATLKAWRDPVFAPPLGEIDPDKLNVNGGSLAAGHPFAATGGRIVASLAKALDERGSGRGVISICAAGGQGVVAILEAA